LLFLQISCAGCTPKRAFIAFPIALAIQPLAENHLSTADLTRLAVFIFFSIRIAVVAPTIAGMVEVRVHKRIIGATIAASTTYLSRSDNISSMIPLELCGKLFSENVVSLFLAVIL
jgi:hypothetical protein